MLYATGLETTQTSFFCRLVGALSKLAAAAAEEADDDDDEENLELVVDKKRVQALQERRCDSKGRGGVYDSVLGICCHFCRYTGNLPPLRTCVGRVYDRFCALFALLRGIRVFVQVVEKTRSSVTEGRRNCAARRTASAAGKVI